MVAAVTTSLLALGATGALTFCVLFMAGSRGWYRTDVGRNLFALPAVIFGLLVLILFRRLLHIHDVFWWLGMASLDAVLWWRVILLIAIRRQRSDSGGE